MVDINVNAMMEFVAEWIRWQQIYGTIEDLIERTLNQVVVTLGEAEGFFKLVAGEEQPGYDTWNAGGTSAYEEGLDEYAYIPYTVKNNSSFRIEDLVLIFWVEGTANPVFMSLYTPGYVYGAGYGRAFGTISPGVELAFEDQKLLVRAQQAGEVKVRVDVYGEPTLYGSRTNARTKSYDVFGV